MDRYDWALTVFVVIDLGLGVLGLALLGRRERLGGPFYGVAALMLMLWTVLSLIASGQLIVTATIDVAASSMVLSRSLFVGVLPFVKRARGRMAPVGGDRP